MKIPDKKYIAIPRMGKGYTDAFEQAFKNLGMNTRFPPKTTDKTVQIGVRNTALMICYPIKPTLGNFAEALDNGANVLLMYNSVGQCRLRHYAKIQELALREMGYNNFEMYNLSFKKILPIFKKLSGKSSIRIAKELWRFYKKIKIIDDKKQKWSDNKPNIGLIGEIFCLCDERTNHGIEKNIERLDAEPVNTVTLSGFIKDGTIKNLSFLNKRRKYDREAAKYLNGKLGGHGIENISHLIELVEKGIDGVIHVMPLSCMPEITAESFVNKICRESKTPLLRIPIDENTAEINLDTRLETFIELIKMRRGKSN